MTTLSPDFERLVQAEVDRRAAKQLHDGRATVRRVTPHVLQQMVNELARIACALESIDNQLRDSQ
jgi:hypothetical protein